MQGAAETVANMRRAKKSAKRRSHKKRQAKSPPASLSLPHVRPEDLIVFVSSQQVLDDLQLQCHALEERKEYEALVEARTRCLALTKLVFGKDDTLAVGLAHLQLANAYLCASLYQQAVDHGMRAAQRLLAVRDRFGQATPEFLDEINMHQFHVEWLLGRAYLALDELDTSHMHLSKALELNKSIHGAAHQSNCQILTRLGNLYAKQGDPQKAIDTFMAVWEIKEAAHGMLSLEMVPVYVDLGRAYYMAGDDEKAQESMNNVLSISAANQLLCTAELADAHVVLAISLKRQGKLEESIKSWTEAIDIYTELEHSQSARVLRAHQELALVYVDQKMYPQAVGHLQQILKAQEASWHFQDELQAAQTLKSMGDVYVSAQDTEQALHCFRKGIVVLKRHVGQDAAIAELRDRIRKVQNAHSQHQPVSFDPGAFANDIEDALQLSIGFEESPRTVLVDHSPSPQPSRKVEADTQDEDYGDDEDFMDDEDQSAASPARAKKPIDTDLAKRSVDDSDPPSFRSAQKMPVVVTPTAAPPRAHTPTYGDSKDMPLLAKGPSVPPQTPASSALHELDNFDLSLDDL